MLGLKIIRGCKRDPIPSTVTELVHFCYKMVHCAISDALWDLWDGSHILRFIVFLWLSFGWLNCHGYSLLTCCPNIFTWIYEELIFESQQTRYNKYGVWDIDGLMRKRRNSIANVLELHLFLHHVTDMCTRNNVKGVNTGKNISLYHIYIYMYKRYSWQL